jgi:hypothetical protein
MFRFYSCKRIVVNIYTYNIVSNSSCRFLWKIKMHYLPIFIYIYTHLKSRSFSNELQMLHFDWYCIPCFLLKVWYALEGFRVKRYLHASRRTIKKDAGIMLNTCCKEIWWNVIVTYWNIWHCIIKGLLHYCWEILSLAEYHTALARSCNMSYCSGQYSSILTVYSSRDSLYLETGWEKLSSRWERKKLCLMYNMYHGHAPSYLCDLLPPLVRDVTNYHVRNINYYTIPGCRLSLYQSSFIPSVINLWNSLNKDTRNTRIFHTFKVNLKHKVVLANIPVHFLVGDRRPNIVYARLRRKCSSLKYDLFRSNIITVSRCVCGYITEDASHFLLNCRLYIEQRTILFNVLHHNNFRKDIRTLLFGDSQNIFFLSNAVDIH